MNHCYRLLFNHRLQLWQAVPEFAKAGRQAGTKSMQLSIASVFNKALSKLNVHKTGASKLKALITCIALGQGLVASGMVHALPAGEDIQFGQATFQTTNHQLTIHQNSQQLIANWQSFGVAAHEAVQLLQPAQGLALFRVVGTESSQIYGQLTATGNLFLINSNGVLFGQGAQVDVGGLVATTMQMSNANFLNGRYQFDADGITGSVTNQGVIKAADGGYIVLLGNSVNNSGTLLANKGSVVLGAAQSAVLDFYGNGLVKTQLSGDALNALVAHSGRIEAEGGAVQLATSARSSAVNVSGLVQANSLVERNGVIRLEGGDHAKVSVSGQLSTAGFATGSKGGAIEVTGEQVALLNGATLDASGDVGGGTVLVGGDYQGNNAAVYNARTTYIDQGTSLNVDAKSSGQGGKAVIWADGITRYYGHISAKGGVNGGNGGLVEVSGKHVLDFIGGVDVTAANGLGGWVLLDPQDIILNTTTQTAPLNNANGTPDVAFSAAPVAGTTTIQITDITGYSELFLQATNNITINNPLTMAVNNSIRLEANNNIAVNGAVTVSGTGSIQLKADADNSGIGNLAIGANITSRAGGMTLSGATITRSAGNIASTGAANANAGSINIAATGTVSLGAATLSAIGGTASAGNSGGNGGNINITAGGYTGTGAIATSGGNGNGANTHGGNAGSISINSTNGINVAPATITASGGNAGATGNGNSGSAGTIQLNNSVAGNITTGAINNRVGSARGTGNGAVAGAVNIVNTGTGNITTGAINTSGNAGSNSDGGTIQLNSSTGNINVGALTSNAGGVLTGNSGKKAGTVAISSGGSYVGTTINAIGSTGLGVSQNGGDAGDITISANNGITATAIVASGGHATATNGNGGRSGTIGLTNNTSGNISTTTLTARNGNATGTGVGGIAGAINVTNNAVGGTVTTTALSTQGGTLGHGGNIQLSALGNTTINGTINSAGGTSLTGNAGRNAGAVNVSSASNVVAGAITATGSAGLGTNQNGGNGSVVTLTAGTGNTITHTNITTSGGARTGTGIGGNGGNININSNALLSANTTIAASVATGGLTSGNVSFIGSINASGANRTLAINTTGATTLAGQVGNTLALASLTTNAGGTTAINGGAVTTTGAQTYNDNVTLGAATVLSTTNSNVTFATTSSVLNAAANNLTIATGTGAVSATNAANNFSNLAISAASANIRDSNAIVLGASNITGNYTLQTAGAVTQTSGVTVGGTTSINGGAANNITLNNPGNNWNAVTVVSGRDVNIVDANALTLNASSVRTMSAQTLSNNLTIAGAITATGTGSGTSITLASAQNFTNSGNFALTPGVGSRWLVYSTNPIADTRGAGLLTASNFKQYDASLGDTILGTGNGFIYGDAPLITAGLSGSTSKAYDGTATASIAGLSLGQSGAIDGDTVNLSALTSASYGDKHVGDNKTVTSNTLAITGANNGVKQVYGYALASPTASANLGQITQRAITVSAVTDSKTYDGNTSAFGTPIVTAGSIVGGDSAAFTQTFNNQHAGTGKTLTANGDVNDGNAGGNYFVTFATNNTGVINPAMLNLNAVTDSKTYDATTTSTAIVTTTGLAGSDTVTGLSQSFASKNVLGTNGSILNVNAGFTINDGNAGNNYQVMQNAASGTILKADIIAVTGITANNKLYDASASTTVDTTGAGFTGAFAGDALSVATAVANFADTNVGTNKIVNVTGLSLAGADATNYNLTDATAIASADITPRPIIVSANPGQNKVIGSTDPLPFTYSVGGMGLVGGDILLGALDRVAGETEGSYAIVQGSLDAGSNYTLTYVGSQFAVLAPSASLGNSSPRDTAGLGSLISANDRVNQSLVVLNLSATSAGDVTDSEDAAEACASPTKRLDQPNTSILINFGMKLPKGVKQDCI